jgi:hypothetical protein
MNALQKRDNAYYDEELLAVVEWEAVIAVIVKLKKKNAGSNQKRTLHNNAEDTRLKLCPFHLLPR